jgi:N-acetylmuramoyl-L-alanine amidase
MRISHCNIENLQFTLQLSKVNFSRLELVLLISQKMLRSILQNTILILLLIITSNAHGQKSIYSVKKIVIDAGHGGKDPGATVGKTYEKDIALDVALRTGKMIMKMFPDVEVLYTRDKLLEDNYATRYEGFDPTSPESYIMFELLQNEYLGQSRLFADMVQNCFVSHAKRKDRGVKQDGFLVLRKNSMPSVLIELGFLSNKEERDFMGKEQGKTILAESIAKAFAEYKKRFDEHNNVAQPQIAAPTVQDRQTQTPPQQHEQQPQKPIVENENVTIEKGEINDISTMKGKWYGTQIMAIKNKLSLKDPILKNQEPVYYLLENGFYKYFVGLSQNSDEAYKSYQAIKALFNGAFLVSFEDGSKKSFK